jgi:hypothetical protein
MSNNYNNNGRPDTKNGAGPLNTNNQMNNAISSNSSRRP